MLAAEELSFLSHWCSNRGLRCASDGPGLAAPGSDAMSFEVKPGVRPSRRMVLCHDDDRLRLLDQRGALLAEASTLPALLDAVDAGIGDFPGQLTVVGVVRAPSGAGAAPPTA